MTTDGNALRIVRPSGDGVQLVFPWVEVGTRTLAIPPGDAPRWRLRMDIRRPRVVVLDTNWITDPRYRAMRELAVAEGHKFMLVWACVAAIAYELIVNDAAIGLGIPGNCYTELGRDRWHAPAGELEDFEASARLALAARIFITIDAADRIATGAYACVRARTHACVDRTGPDVTGPDKTGPDRTGPAAAVGVGAGPGFGAAAHGGLTAGPAASRQVLRSADGMTIDSAHPVEAVLNLATCCKGWRLAARRSAWPVNERDTRDLQEAFKSAVALGKLAELCEVLRSACTDMDAGKGIHWRLKAGGFL